MNLLLSFIAGVLLVACGPAFAGKAVGDMHPEEAYPDNLPPVASPGPYAPMIQEVQQKLHEQGFDAGPVNGEFNTKTQAALAQFQLATVLPASGALDDATMRALGVERPSGVEQSETGEASPESDKNPLITSRWANGPRPR